ncbi:neprilysin-1 [Ceratitis capitata]|uniref:neprilysin-1 n=1 Tax=Ceratitis capitata TaxID=7213 RepID=UPI000329B54C|nr:neprilysin-1 [Ceratitis capitata]
MVRAHNYILIYGISILNHVCAATALPSTTKAASAKDIDALYMEKLLANLNTSVDPCVDFYTYACGNWAQHYDNSAYVDVPGYMDFEVNKQLLNALLAANETTNGSDVAQQAVRYYESCVNLEAPALNAFLRYVQKTLNFEWPILRANWQRPWQNDTEFDWLRVVGGLRAFGLSGVFIMQDLNLRTTNSTQYLLELHAPQAAAALPTTQILRLKSIEDIFVNFGLTELEAHNVSAKVIALDEAINEALNIGALMNASNTFNASIGNLTRTNVTSLEMNVGDLVELVPEIDWRTYLQHVLGRTVDLNQQLVQTYSIDLPYFRQLPALLAAHTNETIAYYIMLKFMYQLNADLPYNMTDAQKSTHCMRLLRGYMPLAANYLYEQHYYRHRRAASDAALQRMFNKLRANFAQLVAANNLKLNATERAYILAELDGMQLRIGNVPHDASLNLTHFVGAYYAHVHMNASDFYGNHLQLIHSSVRRMQVKLLNEPRTANVSAQLKQIYEYDFETSTSSSPIKIFDNVVLVPYGYLQLPLYDHRLDALLQHSLFGFILAHEIMHAYDLFHIVYDQNGNFNRLGLDVAQHYWGFINCTRQTVLSDIVSENMADVAGLRLAYQTYFGQEDSAGEADKSAKVETTITAGVKSTTITSRQATLADAHNDIAGRRATPSTPLISVARETPLKYGNFTRPQLFFINSVQFLCANMPRIEALNVQAHQLGHDMHDVRVRRNWANLEHFAAAFQCAPDTPMNPSEKCRWW